MIAAKIFKWRCDRLTASYLCLYHTSHLSSLAGQPLTQKGKGLVMLRFRFWVSFWNVNSPIGFEQSCDNYPAKMNASTEFHTWADILIAFHNWTSVSRPFPSWVRGRPARLPFRHTSTYIQLSNLPVLHALHKSLYIWEESQQFYLTLSASLWRIMYVMYNNNVCMTLCVPEFVEQWRLVARGARTRTGSDGACGTIHSGGKIS